MNPETTVNEETQSMKNSKNLIKPIKILRKFRNNHVRKAKIAKYRIIHEKSKKTR